MAFQLPESLDGLSASDIQALVNEALDEYNALGSITEESDDVTLDAAEELGIAITLLNEAAVVAEAAAADRRERVERLQNIGVATDAPDDPDEGDEGDEPEADEPEAVVPDEVLEPVAAAAAVRPSQSPVRRAAASAPAVVLPPRRTATLIAAADVPGFSNGQELDDLSLVAAAILGRTKGLPKTNLATAAGGVRQRYGAALIHKNMDPDLVQTKQAGDDMALIAAAGDASRLQGGSLTAAGGWCAPSETFYDLCQYETVEGIIDIPEINVSRGGIRWTTGPSFDEIYEACGFFQTEDDAIAGECKDCCMVECPPFEEIRLDAIGLCIKSPILTETAYPELVRRFTEGALVAHQHKVNKYIIDTIVASAGVPGVALDTGSISITLSAIDFTALGMRYAYRMSQTQDIEVLAPFWLLTVLRNDLSLLNTNEDRTTTDAEVTAWFTARHLRVQWLYDMQDPVVDGCAVTLPTEVTVVLYPSGTWVKGSTDVISLDAVYDSPNLEANQYTALFVEEGILAVQRCTHTCAVTLPVCASGKGVLDDIDVCLVPPTFTPVP